MSSASATSAYQGIPFEQRIFVWSPFGIIPTGAILFILLAGSYILLANLLNIPIFDGALSRVRIESGAYQAVVLSLLVTMVLGLQRFVAVREAEEEQRFIAVSSSKSAAAAIVHPASTSQMRWASVLGILIGVGLALAVIPAKTLHNYPVLFAWHFTVTVFLGMMFGRGVLMTAQGGRTFSRLIEHDLKIDLLHVDKLSVIGRHSARNALVWFTSAAVVCLFFVGGGAVGESYVGGGVSSTTYFIIVVCACMGLWIFIRPMEHVHRRIRAAKAAELDRIRDQIAAARDAAVHDAEAATRLQGLLAYEARIQAVHEWPFDQSTAVRVAAYVLIPAIPWFGEAVVSDVVQRLAQ
jgi:hypothetical protein